MKHKYRVIFPLLLLLFVLSGCDRSEPEKETGYQIYYNTPGGTQLQTSSYLPSAGTFEEIMEELAGQLAESPSGLESVLKNGVKIQGYQRGIDALRIDFSREYYDLEPVDEVLLRAAVVKTFSQVPGVTKIMLTVEDEQLVDVDGNPVPAMDRDDFINTKEGGINSYQSAALSLYFEDPVSQKLSREVRNLHYSSNMVLENMVMEELLKGPKDSGLLPIFTSSVKILSVHVQDGICTIDFGQEINERPAECTADASTALYSIVNSIIDTCDEVEGVRIRIDGMSDAVFRDEIPLNQVFYMELSEVEDYTEAADSSGDFAVIESENEETENIEARATGDQETAETENLANVDAAAVQPAEGASAGDAGQSADGAAEDAQTVAGSAVAQDGSSLEADALKNSDQKDTASSSDASKNEDEAVQAEGDKPGEDSAQPKDGSGSESQEKKDSQEAADQQGGNTAENSGSRKSSSGMVGVDPALAGE